MSTQYGVVTGEVIDVDDPQKEGRIKVRFPALPGRSEAFWAPIATMMSGTKRGSWFMPEKGDEVLVAFHDGQIDHPYILGFLWNGVDKPPHEKINHKVRRIQTVSGHTLDFDDNSDEEKIVLRSKGGHSVTLADAPSASVTVSTDAGHEVLLDDASGGHKVVITTAGGHSVALTDQPTPSVSVQTNGGHQVSLSDVAGSIVLKTADPGQEINLQNTPVPTVRIKAGTPPHEIVLGPAGITISTSTGPLTVNCMQATLNATSALLVNAPITTFSGMVIAPTVIASSVVSPVYTPGAGNLLGL
jgi:phage baseplate assembly protein gpV